MYKERIETCGGRIRKALSVRDMKQADLCRITNIPKSSLSLYLSDACEPKQDRIYIISSALNVSEAWLMGFDVPMEREQAILYSEETITDAEKALLNLFRQVPENKQEMVLQMIRVALSTK